MDELLTQPIILGSRSPQRRELLKLIVPEQRITIAPPQCPDEQGFEGQRYRREIEQTLREIARAKNDDVVAQQSAPFAAVLTADTTILGFEDVFQAPPRPIGAFDDIGFDEGTVNIAGQPHVLGQPPADNWQSVVREWFERFYLGRTHTALTAVCISRSDGMRRELVVATDVHMVPLVTQTEWQLLDWYLATGEPVGKAGGYGIQGAASIFVDEVRGSVSNVIGLPLRETLVLLREMGVVA